MTSARRGAPPAPPARLPRIGRDRRSFLRDVDISVVDGLDCVIGGAGTGKTTLLELILLGSGAPTPAAGAEVSGTSP